MKTRMKKEGDTLIVNMDGRLDFETSEPLKQDLEKIKRQSQSDSVAQIVFNLENLEFVGSSGISSFVQTMREFNDNAASKPRYCNVKSEFKRVIKAFEGEDAFEFFDTEERAKKTIDQ